MTVLDYGTRSTTHRYAWSRLPVAVIIGIAAGVGVAYLAYDPILGLLSRGVQLNVTEIDEPFSLWIRFAAVFGTSGAIVSCVAAVMGSSVRNVLAKVAVFSGLLVIGAAVGLGYAHHVWNPVTLYFPSLASAPMLLVPVSGCAAVLIGFVFAVVHRVAAHRPAV